MDCIQQYPQAMDDHISIVLFPTWFIHIHDYKECCHSVPKADKWVLPPKPTLSLLNFPETPTSQCTVIPVWIHSSYYCHGQRKLKRSLHLQKVKTRHYSLLIGNRSQSGSTSLRVLCPIPAGFSSNYSIVTALQVSSTILKFYCKNWTKLEVLSYIFVVLTTSAWSKLYPYFTTTETVWPSGVDAANCQKCPTFLHMGTPYHLGTHTGSPEYNSTMKTHQKKKFISSD